MNRSVSVGVVVLVVVFLAVLGAPATTIAGADTGSTDSAQSQQLQTHQSQIAGPTQSQSADALTETQDFDRTTFEITVHENGSATWTFQHEQRFDSENETEDRRAFEEFIEEFESEETGLYERFTDQAERMTDSGAELTDREMEATNFQRSATIEERLGTTRGFVEMSFTWEGFAQVDDGTVEVGDVFEDIYIGEDQSMALEAGDGLTFDYIEPEDDARYQGSSLEDASSVHWSGERQFLDGQPHAVLVRDGATAEGSVATWQLAGGMLLALAVVGGALWYRRQRPEMSTGTGTDTTGDDVGTGVTARPDEPAPSSTAPEPGATAGAAAGGTDNSADSTPLPDEELLTDEDRVVKLIRENGGRMKQVNIVDETGWSKSKVSMLLSDMEDDGTISKLRVGRENIISLEGFEPEATKSPFEE